MTTLRTEIANIATQHQPDRVALEVLALFEDKGFSLIGNGWLDDDEQVIDQINEILEQKNHPKFADLPVGTCFIHEGFNKKVSDTEARKIDFQNPEIFIDERPTPIDPDIRVYLARGLNES
ncbi:hypothetical protein [Acaryochloris marina]|uniref:hypothetical protein n=1 Tax=Acaryochloris marina TaxID=155978 RepID=UPI0021C3D104|nr:hypothetical protein [Acaryochloris marina]BDM83892.1 hypothetical protein AM10699_67530 [Acaryochloris marina MBIC10699]